jgi:hypothetical protein
MYVPMFFQCNAYLFEKVEITYHSTTPLIVWYFIEISAKVCGETYYLANNPMPRRLLLYSLPSLDIGSRWFAEKEEQTPATSFLFFCFPIPALAKYLIFRVCCPLVIT